MDARDWFDASPQVCIGCGALVHWNYTDAHDEWHQRLENAT